MNQVNFDFTGTFVLVTGGTSGIGRALAAGFADAGASVAITGTRSRADDYDVDLSGFSYRTMDSSDPASVDAVAPSLDRLDVLINNAGANFPGGLDEWNPDAFAASLALNLAGPMRLTVGCRHHLFASELVGGASVINVASMAAFRSSPLVPGYSSAKSGLLAFTANLANKWARRGVRVNAVAPGLIDTPMTAPIRDVPELIDPELAKIPMGRLGTPDEVVGASLFLASAAAGYITGHTVAVDGGYLVG